MPYLSFEAFCPKTTLSTSLTQRPGTYHEQMHVLKQRGAGLEFVDPYSMLFDRPFITWYPNDEILFFLAKPPFLLYLVEINNPPILPLIFSLKSLKFLYGSLKNPSPYRPAGLLR